MEMQQCLLEYSAFNRLDDMLARLLDDKDVSEMECPQIPMLCATLSSIIKDEETEHFDKAVDILWELYEAVPNTIPFKCLGNLLLDILISKILVDLTNLDTDDSSQLVNDILGLFRIPGDIKLSCENRKWLSEKYEAISKKLIILVHNENRDLTLSYLNLKNCNCFWDNIKHRVDMYLDKVNEKFGLPILEVLIRRGKRGGKEKRQVEQVKTSSSSTGTDLNAFRSEEMNTKTVSCDYGRGCSTPHTDNPSTDDAGETLSADQPEIDKEHQLEISSQTSCNINEDLLNSSIKNICDCVHSDIKSEKQESDSTSPDVLSTVNDGGGKEINNLNHEFSLESCDDVRDCSILSKGGDFGKQTDASEEMNDFSHDENGRISDAKEIDCSILSDGDESSPKQREDQPKFPVISDIPSTTDQGSIMSKSCDSIVLFDSDNTFAFDEIVDKERETDSSNINEQSDSSNFKRLSVDSKAKGNISGHTRNEETVRKDPSTDGYEDPSSTDANSSKDVNDIRGKETAAKDIINIIGSQSTNTEDSHTNSGVINEAISKPSVSIFNQTSEESETTEDPIYLKTMYNTSITTVDVTRTSQNTGHKSDGLQTETIKSIISLEGASNSYEIGGLISKGAGEEDRMLVKDHTSEIENVCVRRDASISHIDSKKDGLGSDLSMNMQTQSNKGNLMGKKIAYNTIPTTGQTHVLPPMSGVSAMHIVKAQGKVVSVVNALRKVCNMDIPDSQRSTDDLVNSGENMTNQNDTSIHLTGATSPLEKASSLPIPASQTSTNDLVNSRDIVNDENDTSSLPTGATSPLQNVSDLPHPASQRLANHLVKSNDNMNDERDTTILPTGATSPLEKVSDLRQPASQRSTNGLVKSGEDMNNQSDTNIIPTSAIIPLENGSDSPHSSNQISSNDLVNSDDIVSNKNDTSILRTDATRPLQNISNLPSLANQTSENNPADQNYVPSSMGVNYPRPIDNTPNDIFANIAPFPVISDVRSLADNPISNDPLNDAKVYHADQKVPVTRVIDTTIVQETGRPCTEFPSSNEQAPSIKESSSTLSVKNNLIDTIGSLVRKFGNLRSIVAYPDCGSNGKNSKQSTNPRPGASNCLPLGNIHSSSTTPRTSGTANSRQEPSIVELNGQYIEINNIKYLLLVRLLPKPNSQVNVFDQKETSNQSGTDVCVSGTNPSQRIVSKAAKNVKSSARGNQLNSRLNKDELECTVTVETHDHQRNAEHLNVVRNQEHFRTAPTSSKESIRKESTVGETPCSQSGKNKQLGLNNQHSVSLLSVSHNHSGNESFTENEKLECISHDHSYCCTPREELDSSNDTNNFTPNRKRSSTFTLSPQVSKKRKTSLTKLATSARRSTKQQQKADVQQLPTVLQNEASQPALSNSATDKRIFSENKESNRANQNTHQFIPARLETNEQQNLDSNKASRQGFPNSTSSINILSESKGSNKRNRITEEKDTSWLNASVTASVMNEDNTTPKTAFTKILPRNASSLPQSSDSLSGESLTLPPSTNSTSEDDRSSVTSPSIFDFFRPNLESKTQDGGSCSSLEKNRWSSTDESSEESINYTQDSIAFIDKKRARLNHSMQIINESARYKDSAEITCDEQAKCTDSSGNSKKTLTKNNNNTEIGNSKQLASHVRSTNSGVSDGTHEYLSKPSSLVRKVSYKRKRTGSLKLSKSADDIHSYKRSRVQSISSEGTNSSQGSNSEVRTSEVQNAEMQTPEVQDAEVQVPEVQSVEVQTSSGKRSRLTEGTIPNTSRRFLRNDEMPHTKRTFLRSHSKKSSSGKLSRLTGGTIANTSGRLFRNDEKFNLDAVVKLVKLKAELLL